VDPARARSLEHQIWAADTLLAEAKSVLVGYDYTERASVPLTEELRRTLAA
jgi:acyl-CoA thioesterase FadM